MFHSGLTLKRFFHNWIPSPEHSQCIEDWPLNKVRVMLMPGWGRGDDLCLGGECGREQEQLQLQLLLWLKSIKEYYSWFYYFWISKSFSWCAFTRNLLSKLLFKKIQNTTLTCCELGETRTEKCDSVSSSWKVLLLLLNAERCSWNIIWTLSMPCAPWASVSWEADAAFSGEHSTWKTAKGKGNKVGLSSCSLWRSMLWGKRKKKRQKKGSQSCFKHLLLQVHHRMISDVSKLFQTTILFKIFASRDLISSWAKQLITCDVLVVLVHLLIFACVSWDLPKAEAAGSPGPGGVWSGVGEEPGEQCLPDFQEGSPKL